MKNPKSYDESVDRTIENDAVARLALEKKIRDDEIMNVTSERHELRDFRRTRRQKLNDDVDALVRANSGVVHSDNVPEAA
jgi:hypothetical protein